MSKENEFRLAGLGPANGRGKRRSSILKQPLSLQLDNVGNETIFPSRPARRISFASHLQLKKYDKEEPGLTGDLYFQPVRVGDSTSPVPSLEKNEGVPLKHQESSIHVQNPDWDANASTLGGGSQGVQMEAASFIATNVIQFARSLHYCNRTVLESVDMSISGIHDKSMFAENSGETSMSLCDVSVHNTCRVDSQDSMDMSVEGQAVRLEVSLTDMSLSPGDDVDLNNALDGEPTSEEEINSADMSISSQEELNSVQPMAVPEKNHDAVAEDNMSLTLSEAERSDDLARDPVDVVVQQVAVLPIANLSSPVNRTFHERSLTEDMSICDISLRAPGRAESVDQSLEEQPPRPEASLADMSLSPGDHFQSADSSHLGEVSDKERTLADMSLSPGSVIAGSNTATHGDTASADEISSANMSISQDELEPDPVIPGGCLQVAENGVDSHADPTTELSSVSMNISQNDAEISRTVKKTAAVPSLHQDSSSKVDHRAEEFPAEKSHTMSPFVEQSACGSRRPHSSPLLPALKRVKKDLLNDGSRFLGDSLANIPDLGIPLRRSTINIAPAGDVNPMDQIALTKGLSDVSQMSYLYKTLNGSVDEDDHDSTKESVPFEVERLSLSASENDVTMDDSISTPIAMSIFRQPLAFRSSDGEKTFVSPVPKASFVLSELNSTTIDGSDGERSQDTISTDSEDSFVVLVEPIKQMLKEAQERDRVQMEQPVTAIQNHSAAEVSNLDVEDSQQTDNHDRSLSPMSKTFVERGKESDNFDLDQLEETMVEQAHPRDSVSDVNVDPEFDYDNPFVYFMKMALVRVTPYGVIQKEGVGKWTITITGRRTAIVLLIIIPLDIGEISLGLERTVCLAKMLIGKISQEKLDKVIRDTPRTQEFLANLIHGLRGLQRTEESVLPPYPTIAPPPAWTFT